MTSNRLPSPHCPMGYPAEQLGAILTERRLDAYYRWAAGSTVALCEGREYDHAVREYKPSACAESPHGVVVYEVDVRRFLAGRPNDD